MNLEELLGLLLLVEQDVLAELSDRQAVEGPLLGSAVLCSDWQK